MSPALRHLVMWWCNDQIVLEVYSELPHIWSSFWLLCNSTFECFFHAVPTLAAMPSVVYVRDGGMATLNCTPSDPRSPVTWFMGLVKTTNTVLQENFTGIKFGKIQKMCTVSHYQNVYCLALPKLAQPVWWMCTKWQSCIWAHRIWQEVPYLKNHCSITLRISMQQWSASCLAILYVHTPAETVLLLLI